MSYLNVLSRLINTPLLLDAAKLQIITENVSVVLLQGEKPAAIEKVQKVAPATIATVIPIHGTLVAKNGTGDSGSVSYTSITSEINSAIMAGVNDIFLWLDSPGGEVTGCFGAARHIAALVQQGKNIYAVVDGSATSGAYMLAAACKKIYATESSNVASIGVVAALVSTKEQDKMQGKEYRIIRSREEKAPYNPHEEISDEVVAKVTKNIAKLDAMFMENILAVRPRVSKETIETLKGDSVFAGEGKTLGLVDEIIPSFDMFMANTQKRSTKMEEETINLREENARLAAEVAKASFSAAEKERARILSILESAGTFHISTETAIKMAANPAISPEIAVTSFEAIAEAMQKANPSPQVKEGFAENLQTKTATDNPFAALVSHFEQRAQ